MKKIINNKNDINKNFKNIYIYISDNNDNDKKIIDKKDENYDKSNNNSNDFKNIDNNKINKIKNKKY